jgi:type II secretion system protein G
MRLARGFTLIELLIVVTVIAILAALAVPNFLASQARSKVARAHSDLRTLAIGLEAYRVDHNAYPSAESNGTMKWMRWATTPVAYLERVHLPDPFTRNADPHDLRTYRSYRFYRYYGFNDRGYTNADHDTGAIIPVYPSGPGRMRVLAYALMSHGPDRIRSVDEKGRTFLRSDNLFDTGRFMLFLYDPTNGAVSFGEILRVGGEPVGRPAPSLRLVK